MRWTNSKLLTPKFLRVPYIKNYQNPFTDGINTSPAGAVAKYCDEYVCVCVCVCLSVCLSVHEDISGTKRAIFTIFAACGSVLLWRCCDTLCTSGFVDVFFYNGPHGEV